MYQICIFIIKSKKKLNKKFDDFYFHHYNELSFKTEVDRKEKI